jgi:tetratricopeptide (TPR) repeat protein
MKNSYLILSTICMMLLFSCYNQPNSISTDTSKSLSDSTPKDLIELNSLLLAEPNNSELYVKRAKYYFENKNFDAALTDMNKAINIDSTKTEYYITLSDIYFITNQSGKTKSTLEKAIKIDPKNTDALLKLAELYLYVQDNKKSIEYINMALRVNQYNAKAYFMKGMNYKELKDTSKAISSMQTAVEQDQQYYHAYIQLGILCATQKNALAIQYYKNAIKIQPNSSEAWYALGKFYQDMGDWKNAIATYSALLKNEPANKYAHYNLGAINLINLKRYDVAINHFTYSIKSDPKYVEAYYSRGVAYQLMGDSKTATLDYQACISIKPTYEPALIKLKQLSKGK